ncbi:MAG TPA: NPCBM/NEW2 domain-containing protein [Pirellulales bacterium]|nr:NPCBM/NEW2 domain-containing protein [Pirellulales bacterium]
MIQPILKRMLLWMALALLASAAATTGLFAADTGADKSADKSGDKGAEMPAQPQPSEARQVIVLTADDKEIKGALLDVVEGALKVDSQPPQSIDLLDLQKLTFGVAAGLSTKWIGQDQHDFVQVGSPLSGNGIQDVHVRLLGLPAQKQVQQIRLVLRSPPHVWLMEPADSPSWRLLLQRTPQSSSADVYFEPPAVDLYDHELQFILTYSDNSTDKLSVKADTHTSDQAQMSAAAPAKTGGSPKSGNSETFLISVDLAGDDSIRGSLEQLTDDALSLDTPWQSNLQIPLLQAQGFLLEQATPEAKKRYAQRRAQPGNDDLAIVLAKDGKLAEIAGRIKKWEGQQLRFVYEGEEHSIAGDRLQAMVFAAHPAAHPTHAAQQVVQLSNGDVLSGSWQGLAEGKIALQMPWKTTWEIPLNSVSEISTRNGNLVHLSDQQPVTAEQTPYFGRLLSYHRDESLDGGPLKMKGKTYAKGLAVHSRCVLNYALDGQFSTFKTTVGFDDAAGTHGNVACRVLADGKELFAKPELRADQDPQVLELSVSGAKLLTLEVDFGKDEDIQDRVIWAEPRLYRK